MKDSSPFSTRTVCLLIAAVVVLIAMSAALYGLGDADAGPSGGRAGPGAHSISSVGYAGLYETLRRLGWRVRRNDSDTLANAVGGVLILAEPDLEKLRTLEDFARKADLGRRVLVVLPKWIGETDSSRSAWITEAAPAPTSVPRNVLRATIRSGEVLRRPWPAAWRNNALGVEPSGDKFVQLMRSPLLEPLLETDEGMLVGRLDIGDRSVWVLADPDVMANHGIGKGDNAEFMIRLLETLTANAPAKNRSPVIFDETIHGLGRNLGSPAQLLFRFPYSLVALLAVLTAALLALAGSGRFGGATRPEPRLGFGKELLIDNSARLLEHSDRRAEIVSRHLELTIRLTAAELHAPARLNRQELLQWLDTVGRARKTSASCSDVLRRAGAAGGNERERWSRLLACAGELYRWRREMTAAREGSHGTRAHS